MKEIKQKKQIKRTCCRHCLATLTRQRAALDLLTSVGSLTMTCFRLVVGEMPRVFNRTAARQQSLRNGIAMDDNFQSRAPLTQAALTTTVLRLEVLDLCFHRVSPRLHPRYLRLERRRTSFRSKRSGLARPAVRRRSQRQHLVLLRQPTGDRRQPVQLQSAQRS